MGDHYNHHKHTFSFKLFIFHILQDHHDLLENESDTLISGFNLCKRNINYINTGNSLAWSEVKGSIVRIITCMMEVLEPPASLLSRLSLSYYALCIAIIKIMCYWYYHFILITKFSRLTDLTIVTQLFLDFYTVNTFSWTIVNERHILNWSAKIWHCQR